jgi:uncharacterized Zn finger protein
MEDYIPEGDWAKVELNCPNCSSDKVVVSIDEFGYYKVIECYKCGYKKLNVSSSV